MEEKLTVATVIFNSAGDEVLLVQRDSGQEWPKTWACPGGEVEPNETLEQAAIREVKEETGIDIDTVLPISYFVAKAYHMCVYLAVTTESVKPNAVLNKRKHASWVRLRDIEKLELAPNTNDSCLHAKQKFQLYRQSISLDNLGQNITKAQRYLLNNVLEYDDLLGWPHYLGRSRIGLIGTSVGILGLVNSGYRGELLHKAAQTLVHFQSGNGGWSTKTTSAHGALGVTESTALAVMALAEIFGPSHQAVAEGITWILRAQDSEGGWGASSSPLSARRVYPTSLASRALAKATESIGHSIENAVSWLEAAQNPDGGWGTYSYADKPNRGNSTASHTAHAIIALIEAGKPIQDGSIMRGVEYLLQNWDFREEEGWESTSEIANLYEDKDEVGRVEYKLYSAPWAVVALLRAGTQIAEPAIIKTINDLISAQDAQGFWPHKFAPGERPIWATADVVMLLKEIEQPKYRPTQNVVLTILYREAQIVLSKFITDYWPTLRPSHLISSGDGDMAASNKWQRRFFIVWNLLIAAILLLILELTVGAVRTLLNLPLLQQTLIWALTVIVGPAIGVFLFEWLSDYLKNRATTK